MNPPVSPALSRASSSAALTDLIALAKPRITLTVLVTTTVGLLMAAPAASLGWAQIAATLAGTVLVVAGANALNMYIERDSDRFMQRTADRPLPAGRMAPWVALVFGLLTTAASLPILWLGAHPAAALLAAFANASYVLAYTPLKQRTWLAVWVGAVPGAIPPLLGWAAATGQVDLRGLSLFGVLFFWQVPHFHAIALFRRDEYQRAGLHVLPVDRDEKTTHRHIAFFTLVLVLASLAPYALGMVSVVYPVVAGLMGAALFVLSLAGLGPRAGVRWSKSFFVATLPYLVGVFVALVATRR